MATMEPDDEFEKLMEGVDFGDLADEVAPDYRSYDTRQLLDEFEAARQALADTGEMIFPKTEEAVSLSAKYHGLLLEMRRRGL